MRKFYQAQAWRFKVSKMVADGKSSGKRNSNKRISLIEKKDEEKVDYSMKPIGLMVYNKTPNGGYVGIANFEVNLNEPFEFYKKTKIQQGYQNEQSYF